MPGAQRVWPGHVAAPPRRLGPFPVQAAIDETSGARAGRQCEPPAMVRAVIFDFARADPVVDSMEEIHLADWS